VWSVGCIFAEMTSGYALFPGRSDIDQLLKIFQRRGTPTAEMYPSCVRLPHYNPEFPKWQPRPISDIVDLSPFGVNQHHAADLLEQLLQYDPDKRIMCRQALEMNRDEYPLRSKNMNRRRSKYINSNVRTQSCFQFL
jgi:serine/threonine protein kinase